jgi:hypothetical protein
MAVKTSAETLWRRLQDAAGQPMQEGKARSTSNCHKEELGTGCKRAAAEEIHHYEEKK